MAQRFPNQTRALQGCCSFLPRTAENYNGLIRLHTSTFMISILTFNLVPSSLVVKALGYKPEGHGFETQ
jgi:hypothetical protein